MYSIQCFITTFFHTNTYIVSHFSTKDQEQPDCVFIIDAGGERQDIQKYIKQLKRCDAFVLTHGHFDHTSGLIFLKRQFPNAPIAIHKEDACYLGEEADEFNKDEFYPDGLFFYVDNFFFKEGHLPYPTITLNDNDVLPFAKDWKVIHTPGHSLGSICLYNQKEAMLFTGDTLFANGDVGRTDKYGGNEEQLKKSISKIMSLPKETKIYPGHGPAFEL